LRWSGDHAGKYPDAIWRGSPPSELAVHTTPSFEYAMRPSANAEIVCGGAPVVVVAAVP
jgi:hypothetical protein